MQRPVRHRPKAWFSVPEGPWVALPFIIFFSALEGAIILWGGSMGDGVVNESSQCYFDPKRRRIQSREKVAGTDIVPLLLEAKGMQFPSFSKEVYSTTSLQRCILECKEQKGPLSASTLKGGIEEGREERVDEKGGEGRGEAQTNTGVTKHLAYIFS